MKRLRNFGRWVANFACGALILAVCMAVSLYDTVIRGRSMDEQLDEATK